MIVFMRTCLLMTALFPSIAIVFAQQVPPKAGPDSHSVRLDVVVAPKSGPPTAGLQQQDFTLTDNKSPKTIKSFKAVTRGQVPVEVILLLDAVNIDFSRVAYARQEVQKFLKADGGHLAHPTTIAFLTDKGTQMQREFSSDGNALSASLDHDTTGLREIGRDTGIWGANERVQISLQAVHELASYASGRPGRTIILWISPGWPLLSGPRIDLDNRQQQQIFGNVVAFSTELRQANVTLYNINPLGPGENLVRADYYTDFLKGVSKPGQTDLADISLQVLAAQSGGLVLQGSSDVSSMLSRCLDDTKAWYEITFDALGVEQPNEYHPIAISVDKPGLSARTRDGYYARP
jgi:VWFA-related protein